MGDRKWNVHCYYLEPVLCELFFQFKVIDGSGTPQLQQYSYKIKAYAPVPTGQAPGLLGTAQGTRGIQSIVRTGPGVYTINLQQTFTRFLQGQITYEVLGTSVYPNTKFTNVSNILTGNPGSSSPPNMTMTFLNPTNNTAIELANGDVIDVQLVFAIGSGQ